MRQPTLRHAANAAAPRRAPARMLARATIRAAIRAIGHVVAAAAALAAAGFAMLAGPVAAHDCKCRHAGRDWSLGERACFRLDGASRLMECRMNQNITAWVPVADGCPSAAAIPAAVARIAAPASHSRPASVTILP